MSTVTIPGPMTSVEAFIEFHFQKYDIRLSSGSTIRGEGTEACPASVILHYEKMYQATYSELRRHDPENKPKLTRFKADALKYALEMHLVRAPLAMREPIKAALRFNSGLDHSELAKWVIAVTGTPNKLYEGIMKHFLWQVKRKTNKLPVVHHLCPILFGFQGCGKSTAINILLSPLQDMVMKHSPKEATDPRNAASLNTHFVVFFDEMPMMDKVDLPSLKDIISTDTVTYRPLHTNGTRKVEQNCTFIGASNTSVAENIKDTTGGRRFAEIICPVLSDRAALNVLDVNKIWQSIDENLPRGYFAEFDTELTALQDAATEPDEVAHFVEDYKLRPETDGEVRFVSTAELYQIYISWQSGKYGDRLYISTFSRKLRTAALICAVKTENGAKARGYYINKKSSIGAPVQLVTYNKAEFI